MGEKQQVSFKLDSDVVERFDNALDKYKEVTGIKPKKLECFEVAVKDYIEKLEKQIEALKSLNS
ncbi:hypothetical protein [uncultured Sunxiuqinia sp.]|uniref:hypothetical protein n=1 Tax=uncultured Sunxiuqinia sp. TaxID=1573825 RepID=UPI002615F3F8|nr:hypothetical protein [uncultured Sunxiuqinia sp.]